MLRGEPGGFKAKGFVDGPELLARGGEECRFVVAISESLLFACLLRNALRKDP